MTYPTVTLGVAIYDVYASQATADAYLAADVTAASWATATNDQKAQALVSSTRLLNRQTWQGTATDTMAWPRTGTTDDAQAYADVIEASILIAASLIDGTDVITSNGVNLQRRLKAGSVEIENFRQDPFSVSRWPMAVGELVNKWLDGGVSVGLGYASGTDQTSELGSDYGFTFGY